MSTPLTQPGGYELFNSNEKISAADLNNIGLMALQSITSILALLVFRMPDGTFIEGFPGGDCLTTVTGSLQVTVASGVALLVDTATSFTGFEPCARVIVVPAAVIQAVNAHHATLPRKDLVYLQASYADADSTTDSLRDPTTGVVSTSSIYKRKKLSYSVGYLAGTAHASPTPPAVPTGALALATVHIPATSGAITVTDRRRRLHVSPRVQAEPQEEYTSDHTVEGGETSAGSGLTVTVSPGIHVFENTRIFQNQVFELGLSAAHVSDTRFDLVYVDTEGIAHILEGTPGAGVPTPDPEDLVLAVVEIGPGASVPTDIQDYRQLQPYGTGQIQRGAITMEKVQQNRIQGLFAKAKSSPDMTIETTPGLVNVGGAEAFHAGAATAVTISAATSGKEKVGILQVDSAGTVSAKYGAEVNAGLGTAAYPAADAGNIILARVGTPGSPITNATTQVTQAMLGQTGAVRSWF